MAVYVDTARNPYGRMFLSHMMADTLDELHTMADHLELKRSWFQPQSRPHYDICQAKKQIAIRLGAIEVSTKELVNISRRNNGKSNS